MNNIYFLIVLFKIIGLDRSKQLSFSTYDTLQNVITLESKSLRTSNGFKEDYHWFTNIKLFKQCFFFLEVEFFTASFGPLWQYVSGYFL